MSLKFEISGPVYTFDEDTKFTFKRISLKQVYQWELKNSVLNSRSAEIQKEFSERAQAGVSNWDFYTGEEKAQIAQLGSNFCIDHIEKIEGPVDENGVLFDYFSFDDETKQRFWDEMQEVDGFLDWLSKYKAGGEKKSNNVAEVD
jgi:hypothetical protein